MLFADPDRHSGDESLKATGVEFRWGSNAYVVHAGKEVILSAGAIKSPQILELSGIGRRDVLDRIGVNVKIELPGVGENVQEHISSGIVSVSPGASLLSICWAARCTFRTQGWCGR